MVGFLGFSTNAFTYLLTMWMNTNATVCSGAKVTKLVAKMRLTAAVYAVTLYKDHG